MQAVYIILLLATGTWVAVRVAEKGDLALLLCAATVVANWTINTFYVLATGETDATTCFIAADTLSLACVLAVSWRQAPGQMLASSYVGQILANSQHGLSGDDAFRNWMLLTLLAFGQLAVLAVWAALPIARDAGREPV